MARVAYRTRTPGQLSLFGAIRAGFVPLLVRMQWPLTEHTPLGRLGAKLFFGEIPRNTFFPYPDFVPQLRIGGTKLWIPNRVNRSSSAARPGHRGQVSTGSEYPRTSYHRCDGRHDSWRPKHHSLAS